MQKLSGMSSGKIKKVVGFFTTKPRKFGLRFSVFSTIFYGIYKIQQITITIEVTALQSAPWIFRPFTTVPSFCGLRPRKVLSPCNVALGGGGRRGSPESG
jgi:hypothetical protein